MFQSEYGYSHYGKILTIFNLSELKTLTNNAKNTRMLKFPTYNNLYSSKLLSVTLNQFTVWEIGSFVIPVDLHAVERQCAPSSCPRWYLEALPGGRTRPASRCRHKPQPPPAPRYSTDGNPPTPVRPWSLGLQQSVYISIEITKIYQWVVRNK